MSEWKEVRLGDVCENISRTFDFNNRSKVIFINTGDVLNGRFLHFNYTDKKILPGQAKKSILRDDILFSEIRPKNKRFAYINFDNTSDFVVSTKFMVLESNQKLIFPKYLYLLITSQEYLDIFQKIAESRSGTFPQITFTSISNIEIKLPPLLTQKKIADILSVIDEKIETLQNINSTLEEMAKAIFKSWFVDFEIVKAKKEGKSDGEIAKEFGISEEIVKLFPDEFVDSEIGMIPKGWEVKNFGSLLEKHIGGDWGKDVKDLKYSEKVKIIRGTDIPKIKNLDFEEIPTRFVESKKLKTRQLLDGDIIIEISGGTKGQPTGRSLFLTHEIIKILGCKVEPASFCRLFRPISKKIGVLIYYHLLYIYDKGKMWMYQNQSTGISNFQTKYFLEEEKVLIPSNDLIENFYKTTRPLIDRIYSSEKPILQNLRDTLLPKLINGEIEVDKLNIYIS